MMWPGVLFLGLFIFIILVRLGVITL